MDRYEHDFAHTQRLPVRNHYAVSKAMKIVAISSGPVVTASEDDGNSNRPPQAIVHGVKMI